MITLVSGKNGQLGKALQDVASLHQDIQFIFFDKEELNIADEQAMVSIFKKYAPSFFINCAAYTAVDKAETEQEKAFRINAEAVGNIAKQCHQFNTKLIHVSTDYVFDGKGEKPYKEDDETNPVNYYGYTKLKGEEFALKNNANTIIIRTSWVYSKYGNNFVKTMLRLMNERKEINVVNDQFGSPTYAKDLAEAIVEIANCQLSAVHGEQFGIYHFSNAGIISWYDFAVAIKELRQLVCTVNPIPTSAYPTPAKRPAYSGLDKTKIANTFDIEIKNWRESLQDCLKLL
ncbi:MAG: dTDP-4-dehydrorhamnose reductase [Parafilimonas sp.]